MEGLLTHQLYRVTVKYLPIDEVSLLRHFRRCGGVGDDRVADNLRAVVPSQFPDALFLHLALYDDGIGTLHDIFLEEHLLRQLVFPVVFLQYPRLQLSVRRQYHAGSFLEGEFKDTVSGIVPAAVNMQDIEVGTLQFLLGSSLRINDYILCPQTHTVHQHVHITGDHAVVLGYVMKYPHGA